MKKSGCRVCGKEKGEGDMFFCYHHRERWINFITYECAWTDGFFEYTILDGYIPTEKEIDEAFRRFIQLEMKGGLNETENVR